MPRPSRIRERETARAGNASSPDEVPENIDTPLDDTPELEQPSRSGPVEDGEFIREVAKRAGWTEDRERNGKPIKDWQDERDFLLNLPERHQAGMERLSERLKRTDQVMEAVAEEARQNALREAEARLSGAVRTGDEDAAKAAAHDVARNSGPHPSTVNWISRNSWFTANGRQGDDEATAVAITAIKRAESVGAKVEEALAAGEAAVRKRFPEHFPDEAQKPREEVRRQDPTPPAVAGGSRALGGAKATKDKTFADIPAKDREQMQQFIRKAERQHGKKPSDTQAFLAAAYWKEKAA